MTGKIDSPHTIQIKTFRNKRLEDVPVLYEAVKFFLDELFKRCTIEYKLNIRIAFRKGQCIADDDGSRNEGLVEEVVVKGETWYYIAISNDASFLDILSTIAHELVHVHQFATGRLNSEDDWTWEGVSYGEHPYTGTELDNQLPWEYDAYSKEIELARKFVKQHYSNW